ncbi:hypothetical protein Mgra_00002798 [Meloidogyne graminicola]|uniref:Uncharacterized protein n=1 Tax=Meloidogyne graminicola TaxID=189291 RepID=A0A8S9ZXE0_9BILA|nr:hypothetical protein Mgra_00002798 [Meloidogyne graminicola]
MPLNDRKNNYSSTMLNLERGNTFKENILGRDIFENNTNITSRNSRLPLSTARYRSTTNNNQVQNLTNKFMNSSGDGTEPVTDSLRLNKYKPRNSSVSTSISSSKSSPKINIKIPTISRSASALPPLSRNKRSISPGISFIGQQNLLQTSASYSSISVASINQNGGGGNGIKQQQIQQKRPYGLMRVQSTSSAVERKPAQIRCQVISMN